MISTRNEKIPCQWCGDLTRMLGTKECDNCHEVRMRIYNMPDTVLEKIIGSRNETTNP